MRRLAFSAALAALAVVAPRAQSFQGLGDFPGGTAASFAFGVSADGAVVVGYGTGVNGEEAFRWTAPGGLMSLSEGDSTTRVALGVSADGGVVVGVSAVGEESEAFRWTADGGLVGLGDLPGGIDWSGAYAVSADGSVVVGDSYSGPLTEAYRWTADGGMVGLGYLPDGGARSTALGVSADGAVVVGYSVQAPGGSNEAFRWTAAGGMVGLGDLPGGPFASRAYDASADGSVVVGDGRGAEGPRGFRWTAAGGMQPLAIPPGAVRGDVRAVSADGGLVVGSYAFQPGNENFQYHAALWTADGAVYDLQTLLTGYGLDLTGWTLQLAFDVSPDGRFVVGYGKGPDGSPQAWRAEILPLPTAAEGGATAGGLALTVAPNPARGAATVTLTLDVAQAATVEVYDALGRRVAALHDGTLAAGPHAFALDAAGLPPGVYVARAVTGGAVVTHRLTVVR